MDAKISSSFWSDPDMEKVDPEVKLAFIWLLTNPQRTICGFSQISYKRFSFDTGLDINVLDKSFKALSRALKPFQEKNIVYVRNFITFHVLCLIALMVLIIGRLKYSR